MIPVLPNDNYRGPKRVDLVPISLSQERVVGMVTSWCCIPIADPLFLNLDLSRRGRRWKPVNLFIGLFHPEIRRRGCTLVIVEVKMCWLWSGVFRDRYQFTLILPAIVRRIVVVLRILDAQ